jgi:hypothetical protein
MYGFEKWDLIFHEGKDQLFVDGLRLLRRAFTMRMSALSQRPGPYGHFVSFVTELF